MENDDIEYFMDRIEGSLPRDAFGSTGAWVEALMSAALRRGWLEGRKFGYDEAIEQLDKEQRRKAFRSLGLG